MEETEDMIMNYIVLIAICAMIGWLLFKYTGCGEGMIEPVYWAGVATPLLSQITKKMFKLIKKV